MRWQVGVDEAGYGPNLGPFVMTLVSLQVPASAGQADGWTLLSRFVRRLDQPADHRVVVADSKQVHAPGRLRRLEAQVLPFVLQQCIRHGLRPVLGELWQMMCLTPALEWLACPWAEPQVRLPLSARDCERASWKLASDLEEHFRTTGIGISAIRWAVVFPAQFNHLVRQHGTKAAVGTHCLQRLLAELAAPRNGLPKRIAVQIDKQGGRTYYAGLLQQTFAEAWVQVAEETARAGRYVVRQGRTVLHVAFQPGAEEASFPVALASMLSKYLRELLMDEFNRYWQRAVPGLKGTAGYPKDAKRFLREIETVQASLGLPSWFMWRER
jgi:ribonuclease HII